MIPLCPPRLFKNLTADCCPPFCFWFSKAYLRVLLEELLGNTDIGRAGAKRPEPAVASAAVLVAAHTERL